MNNKNDNSIVLYFADDGESICDFILASLDKFKYTVRKHNICIRRPPEESKVFILVLTPEMLEELEIRPKHFLKKIASGSVNQALIHHDVIDVKNSNTRRVFEYQCPDSLTWKCLSIGKNDEEFKMTCFQIFALIDTNFKAFQVPTLVNFKLTPKEIWTAKDDVIITFKKTMNDKNMSVLLRHQCGLSNIVQCLKLNDTAYKFNPEGMPEGEVLVEVLVDNSSLGKTSFVIRPKMQLLSDLLDDVINPIDFICKTMKTENPEALDLNLSEKFSNFKTPRIPLTGLENLNQEENSKIFADASDSELPTILHFAAKYGLRRFCETLMKYPGYKAARLIKNKDDKTPSEIALLAGHGSLSEQIQNTECVSDYEEINIALEETDSDYLTFPMEEEENTCTVKRPEFQREIHAPSFPPKCPERDSGVHGSSDSGSAGSMRRGAESWSGGSLRSSGSGGSLRKMSEICLGSANTGSRGSLRRSASTESGDSYRSRTASRLSLLENEALSLPGNFTDNWS